MLSSVLLLLSSSHALRISMDRCLVASALVIDFDRSSRIEFFLFPAVVEVIIVEVVVVEVDVGPEPEAEALLIPTTLETAAVPPLSSLSSPSPSSSFFKKSYGSISTFNPRARNTTGRLLNLAHGTSNWTLSKFPDITRNGLAKLGASTALRHNSVLTAETSNCRLCNSILPDHTATLRDSASRLWTYRPMVLSRTSRMAFLAMIAVNY